ncbi:hypothetical protein FB451DRAFT_1223300 [Mycena latifolia]|nr:hypothetical protein FB451DRAFT_1223300 [Mycena latifolia]
MASGEESSPFFPPELEREIFETAAELYPETIYWQSCLLLVAKRVYEWIERIKYRTVTSALTTQACRLRLLQNALRFHNKPADFFRNRVRHLFIEYSVPHDELPLILSACTGIRSLALLNRPGPSILPSLAVIQPRRLAINLFDLFKGLGSTDISHSAFTFVTHLELFDSIPLFSVFQCPWASFVQLPALTHLALNCLNQLSAMEILSSCPRIEVLVSLYRFAPPANRQLLPSTDDARFVSLSMAYGRYVNTDWIAGTKGGADFWVRAERFIAKKRRGEIQPSSRCWIEDGDGI